MKLTQADFKQRRDHLAQKMGASYFHVDKISEDRLLCIGRQTAYERGQYDL